MANETIHDQPAVLTAAAADEIALWVVASGLLKRITKANFLGGYMAGGGTIATGGFTLTVPASGTAALLGTPQVFTGSKSFSVTTTGTSPLIINMVAGTTGYPIVINYNGMASHRFYAAATTNRIALVGRDLGDNVVGSHVQIDRNTNAAVGTVGPAAGHVLLQAALGGYRALWVDATGQLRINGLAPTGSTGSPTVADTAGVVVGDQTSAADAKNIDAKLSPPAQVFARIAAGASAVRGFVYKDGAYDNERFEGVVTDFAPAYGKDRDDDHPAGKALNEIQIIGDLLRAVADLTARVADLEMRLV